VKKLRKSVDVCQSYHKNKRVSFFMAHSVHLLSHIMQLFYMQLLSLTHSLVLVSK